MNQGRIWCVVHPTVGLPLFLGSVAVTSLIVHASVMSHTTWMSTYWQGASKGKTAMNEPQAKVASADASSPFAITIAPVAATAGTGQTAFMVTVTPNQASATKPETTAAIAAPEQKTIALAGSVEK